MINAQKYRRNGRPQVAVQR